MSAEQTTRPVVDVLREHIWWPTSGQCSCGALHEVPMSIRSAWDLFAQHQADALAAEGYPVTVEGLAEHDREVAARALLELAERMRKLVVSGSYVDVGAIVEERVDAQINRLHNPAPLSQTEPRMEVVE